MSLSIKFLITIVILLVISLCNGYNSLKKCNIRMNNNNNNLFENNKKLAKILLSSSLLILPFNMVYPVYADQQVYKLPPIDRKDNARCQLKSSAMGQANAARDKLYDLRECDLTKEDGAGKDISGVIGADADFSGVNFKEAQLSKGYLRNSKFIGTDFTNAVVDRVSFDGSDMRKAIFINAVLSGTTFLESNLEDTDFSDSYLGPFDLKNLCSNPTLKGKNPKTGADTKASAGCLSDE